MKVTINHHPYDIETLFSNSPCRHCGHMTYGLYFFSFKLIEGDTICPSCKRPITTFSEEGKQEYIDLQKQFFDDLKKVKKSPMYFYKKVAK